MITQEKMEEIIFGIISSAGMAKGLIYEAMEEASKDNFDKADELLKEADSEILKAHNIQTEIIQAEARGDNYPVSVLFVHAQDHLMTTMEVRTLADVIIKLNKKLVK